MLRIVRTKTYRALQERSQEHAARAHQLDGTVESLKKQLADAQQQTAPFVAFTPAQVSAAAAADIITAAAERDVPNLDEPSRAALAEGERALIPVPDAPKWPLATLVWKKLDKMPAPYAAGQDPLSVQRIMGALTDIIGTAPRHDTTPSLGQVVNTTMALRCHLLRTICTNPTSTEQTIEHAALPYDEGILLDTHWSVWKPAANRKQNDTGAPWPLANRVRARLQPHVEPGTDLVPGPVEIREQIEQLVDESTEKHLVQDTALAMAIHLRRAAGLGITPLGEEMENACMTRGIILDIDETNAAITGPWDDAESLCTAGRTAYKTSGATLLTPCETPGCDEMLAWHVYPGGQLGPCRRPGCRCATFTTTWASTESATTTLEV
ncbi:hypothetical protein [Streptomyces nanshensis]|uniref:Uncharacterized protein n=1 Tax=Streptomyces nanshensis TaxID=518642 RepID=A0A1E7L577_9ACTN|nr:hypothetical protein [Streptomyces nanshensis]OEV11334.1 hypothetical protein AN218_13355 [Streptomyces nanshensis]